MKKHHASSPVKIAGRLFPNPRRWPLVGVCALLHCLAAPVLQATEFHVAVNGKDSNPGTKAAPLKTIQRGAELAQPGDVVTVHEGIYRERVNPPRGGASDQARIVYQAAAGEKVSIKGSEVAKNWESVGNDVWKTVIPNALFGEFNPYSDRIGGDWFDPKGRVHHTGCVYLNGDWLVEATSLDEVLKPAGKTPLWFAKVDGDDQQQAYLLNVAWLRIGNGGGEAGRIAADRLAKRKGCQPVPCFEGGQCMAYIRNRDWIRYDKVDFGERTEQVELRAASLKDGGLVELRLDTPDGELLGTCDVAGTGDWQKWSSFRAAIKPTGGVKNLCLLFKARGQENQAGNTTIWAQFKGVNPNQQTVEINVRQTVFYPDKPGRNHLTVRGFTLEHAATPWAPPTAEQIGVIGTNWSKGWIIENNLVRYSKCSGITLGKHGDEWDNTSADTPEGYVKTIERALANGWNRETVGHHLVRNNEIAHCEQAGVVGSLGCSFSTLTGNAIHDIHVRQLFSGAEMAGIKFHGAVDVVIAGNHVYRTCRGIWLDWMAQGAQVRGNLLHDNHPGEDLFFEVNHGPLLVADNVSLSPLSVNVQSQGCAFVHNLLGGNFFLWMHDGRQTPFHPPHSTALAGMHDNPSGDDRFYNNLFVARGDLRSYDAAGMPVQMDGNVFLKGAVPSKWEKTALHKPEFDPQLALVEKPDGFHLTITIDRAWAAAQRRKLVTGELLGKAAIPDAPFENPDRSPLRLDRDYLGGKRPADNPFPGPFELPQGGKLDLKVWPLRTAG